MEAISELVRTLIFIVCSCLVGGLIYLITTIIVGFLIDFLLYTCCGAISLLINKIKKQKLNIQGK